MDARTRFSFSRFLQSKTPLVFSIVSEPPLDHPDDPCIDLCFAEWCLSEATTDGRVGLKMVNDQGMSIGSLELEWQGADLVKRLLVTQELKEFE